MKKHSIIFPALLLTLTTMPFSVSALTVSGTVRDATDVMTGASVVLINSDGTTIKNEDGTPQGTTTGMEGHFEIKDVPDKAQLKISYLGYKTQTVTPQETLNVILVEDPKVLDQVVVAKCKNETKEKLKATEATATGAKGACIPTECIGEPGEYEIKGTSFLDEDSNQCTSTKLDEDGEEREVCEAICVKVKCTETELKNATGGKVENGQCIPVCDEANGFTRNIRNICERTKCAGFEIDNLKKQDKNIDSAELDKNGTCVPICKKNYHLNKTTQRCEENKCPTAEEDWNGKECVKVRCTEEQKQAIYAKEAKWENNTCIATDCEEDKNFRLESGKCICKDTYTLQNGACINKQKLEELQKAYDEAKAKEQSTENKLLGGLTTAATGIGTMELMQGMAEQSSDKDAAADMAAYIETMRCTYGAGNQVKAGPEEIELPGANDQELMNLRGQYLSLAADLKERKEALGIKPGIESEVIVDRTQTGLYDDETIGITGGNYASLYRAQALKSEADQAKIDDAAAASKRRVTGGAIAAGAGVVGGITGNSLINGKLGQLIKEMKEKNKSSKANEETIESLKKGLASAKMKNVDKLDLSKFDLTGIKDKISNTDFTKLNLSDKDALKDINTSNTVSLTSSLEKLFSEKNSFFEIAP